MKDGYFSADSVIRRVGNRSVLMLGGPRALLLSAAVVYALRNRDRLRLPV